eukprot:GHUV01005069.1.p1 GENE.GHUV01005069.1~~GHUV01005069.1.p1  ORF type:complete len:604 (+),score=195.01 GHUV01005069.1:379-2190(+)
MAQLKSRKNGASPVADSPYAWAHSHSRYLLPEHPEQVGGLLHPAQPQDEELIDLWDNIWFGVSCSPDTPPVRRKSKFTVDPLENVPIIVQSLIPALPQSGTAVSVEGLQPLLQPSDAQPVFAGPKSLGFKATQPQQQPLPAPAVKPRGPPTPEAADQQMVVSSGSGEGQRAASSVVPVPDKQDSDSATRKLQQSTIDHQQQGGPCPVPYVLGTWAQRQYRNIMPVSNNRQQAAAQQQQFLAAGSVAQPIPTNGRWPSANAAIAEANGSGCGGKATAAPDQDPAVLAQVHGSHAAAMAAAVAAGTAEADAVDGRHSTGTEDEDESLTQAAWRWRFAKRWQAEQARAPHDPAASVGDGGMEEALQYLAACGENWHLARATSTEVGCTAESRMLGTLGTPSLLGAELLVDEGSYAGSGRGGLLQSTESGGYLSREVSMSGMGRGEATQQVTGITKRAAQLLAAQSDINKAVTQRWRELQAPQASDLWVGALLESVEVDDWGKYKFLLLRIRDRAGRQKLLVRGANYASDARLVEGLHRQMMSACAAHDITAETIEVVGGGMMEWRRHRDRHLHISGQDHTEAVCSTVSRLTQQHSMSQWLHCARGK